MIFKVKWGDMESLLQKRFSLETESKSPTFYFEDTEITVYIPKRGYILCSSILLESITDLVAFKQEFLSNATELIDKPKTNTFVIKQE